MNQSLDLIPKNNLSLPDIPEHWDYDESVSKVNTFVYKWKTLKNEAPEVLKELWIAKRKLSKPGTRTDLTSEQKFRGWTDYCEDIGSSVQVVNRWLQNHKRLQTQENKKEQPELPTDKYRVIYADPPWNYGNSGLDDYGHAERHYPTMSIQELCEMEISDILDDNAVLFLWVTSPLLEDSFKIIKAWDFKYKTSFVWDKVKHNFGYYNSVRHEFLLIATKGSCIPDIKKLHDSVVSIERTKHSEKPEYFRNLIDELYPHGKRIELFARNKSENWDDWGNEL
jgi:N6-adenosine-specific RNA methylase IME4